MTAKEVRAERQRRSHVASEDEESDPDEEDSSSQVFIWLLRIPTCTGSISCAGSDLTLSYTIARPPLQLLREKLESDDQVYTHTQTQTCQIRIKIGAGKLQPNRQLWDESINDHYAFAGIPKLNAQVDNEFTF